MRHLATIGKRRTRGYNIRNAVRIVLFDRNGSVPMIFTPKLGYHKLPGGGIEPGESKLRALAREIKEEVGATFRITGTVGTTVEWKNRWHQRQTSCCYTGKIITKGLPTYTEEEHNSEFRVVWFPSIDEIIETLNKDISKEYEWPFIKRRERAFLERARTMMHTSTHA